MITSTEIRKKAIQLVEQLPKEMLPEAIEILESLCTKASQFHESTESKNSESMLIETIQYRLSMEEQTRLDYLREQNEWADLTASEYDELLAYEDKLENINVERVNALMELSKLRNIDIVTLKNQFQVQNFN